jgi:hypothetical protein
MELYPILPLLPCDHEEAHTITGVKSAPAKKPCPLCTVRYDDMAESTAQFELRTSAEIYRLMDTALDATLTLEARKAALRELENLSVHLHEVSLGIHLRGRLSISCSPLSLRLQLILD